MNILIINCGSSSIKYRLVRAGRFQSLVSGIVENIGTDKARIINEHKGGKRQYRASLPDYESAIQKISELLSDPEAGAIKDKSEIFAVGHRVVHGGEEFKSAVIIDKYVLSRISFYSRLAPLHNPPAVNGIKAAMKIFPDIPQAAVFDTAFHQTMPSEAYVYALPYDYYRRYGIRRYGFHGTSHRYVANTAAARLKKPLTRLKLITCHLGNGCSITAVRNGISVDTSMGFTPLEGLVMGTRCGDLDPALVGYIMEKEKLSIEQISQILNSKSGLLGISGISNDMRDLITAAEEGEERARLAIDIFIYRVKKYIGAYLAVMDGADAVVLTAGIGENFPQMRTRLKRELKNLLQGTPVMTIATNEEKLIAQDTFELVRVAGKR